MTFTPMPNKFSNKIIWVFILLMVLFPFLTYLCKKERNVDVKQIQPHNGSGAQTSEIQKSNSNPVQHGDKNKTQASKKTKTEDISRNSRNENVSTNKKRSREKDGREFPTRAKEGIDIPFKIRPNKKSGREKKKLNDDEITMNDKQDRKTQVEDDHSSHDLGHNKEIPPTPSRQNPLENIKSSKNLKEQTSFAEGTYSGCKKKELPKKHPKKHNLKTSPKSKPCNNKHLTKNPVQNNPSSNELTKTITQTSSQLSTPTTAQTINSKKSDTALEEELVNSESDIKPYNDQENQSTDDNTNTIIQCSSDVSVSTAVQTLTTDISKSGYNGEQSSCNEQNMEVPTVKRKKRRSMSKKMRDQVRRQMRSSLNNIEGGGLPFDVQDNNSNENTSEISSNSQTNETTGNKRRTRPPRAKKEKKTSIEKKSATKNRAKSFGYNSDSNMYDADVSDSNIRKHDDENGNSTLCDNGNDTDHQSYLLSSKEIANIREKVSTIHKFIREYINDKENIIAHNVYKEFRNARRREKQKTLETIQEEVENEDSCLKDVPIEKTENMNIDTKDINTPNDINPRKYTNTMKDIKTPSDIRIQKDRFQKNKKTPFDRLQKKMYNKLRNNINDGTDVRKDNYTKLGKKIIDHQGKMKETLNELANICKEVGYNEFLRHAFGGFINGKSNQEDFVIANVFVLLLNYHLDYNQHNDFMIIYTSNIRRSQIPDEWKAIERIKQMIRETPYVDVINTLIQIYSNKNMHSIGTQECFEDVLQYLSDPSVESPGGFTTDVSDFDIDLFGRF